MSFTFQDIYDAYRKFKTFVYYNGQPLILRKNLAKFELDMLACDDDTCFQGEYECSRHEFKNKFKDKFQLLLNVLNGEESGGVLESWLNKISYKIVPKQLKEAPSYNEHYISNEVLLDDFVVEKCNIVIDAPIEIYIISTIWMLRLGKRLDHLISNDNYAYRLSIFDRQGQGKNEDAVEISSGLMMFEPYFIGYKQWRDNGLNKISQALDDGDNAAILSLDIKRYFYNVRINVREIVERYIGRDSEFGEDDKQLCDLLQKVHEQYSKLFPDYNESENKKLLPIGLPSSGFLGNLYLKPFDDYIRSYVTPAYYGRYVDDILIVFSGKGMKITPHPESHSYIDGFITDHLVCDNVIDSSYGVSLSFRRIDTHDDASGTNIGDKGAKSENSQGKVSDVCYCIELDGIRLDIQLGKIIMEYFNSNESRAAVNKFKKQLEKNRSEFRYLPWEEEINLEFDDEAFRLEISDSVNKIRNIQGISEDKYGASKYLAKKIFLSILPFESASKEEAEASAKQILTYFKGRTTILMNSLWEKVATYFVINNEPSNLERFWSQAIRAIDKVKLELSEDDGHMPGFDENDIRKALKEHLLISTAMAVALYPDILTKCFIRESVAIKELALKFRKTYLFRHQYQYLKGYCYTLPNNSAKSLVCKNLISENIEDFQEYTYAPFVSPVFLKPHEIMLLHIYHKLSTNSSPSLLDTVDIDNKFWKFNYEWRDMFVAEEKEQGMEGIRTKFFKNCFDVCTVGNRNPSINIIDINDEKTDSAFHPDKKVGIVNWKIEEADLIKCICGNPNKSNKRREKLFEVLNYSSKKHVEMIIFPETSIPVEWLPLLVDQTVRNDCAIIGGLEFYVTPSKGSVESVEYLDDMYVYNFIFNIFPVKMNCYDTAAIVIRKKNYYAPAEQKLIAAYHKIEPKVTSNYHLIHWRKSYFSTYNCFELSNISDRSIFKSKVDFIVAIEYNRDTQYFANITEAWTRDLHCFIVQSNSSDYGDTKVVQPTKSVNMDVMKIKGGDFPLVMITTLPIDKLRKYHRQDIIGQIDDKSTPYFKPTPACYEWKWAERRLNDESPSKEWFGN